ncbi:MAG: NUDIX domain-containing protein [Patescibacteria group bacterium]
MGSDIVISPVSGRLKCKSVGAIVKCDGKILMLDRRKGVFGWACPAGHVEDGESTWKCIQRELMEETGIKIYAGSCVLEADINNACKKGAFAHQWEVHEISVTDPTVKLMEPDKHKGIGWFIPEELLALSLEPVWGAILERVGVFNYTNRDDM